MLLNETLKRDTFELGHINQQLLLLMNNALVPWFIIVPSTNEIEIFKMPENERTALEKNIDLLSEYILNNFQSEKLNIAAIGNIVKQLHIHVIGRHSKDFCWPHVVWGQTENKPYTEVEVRNIIESMKSELDGFIANNALCFG